MAGPPMMLIEAFRAIDEIAAIAVITSEEGFDVDVMKVLAAWRYIPNEWNPPRRPMPDGGRPTAATWAWLLSGWSIDIESLAIAAGVSRQLANEKISILRENRLIFPDGTLQKSTQAALNSHVASRVTKRQGAPKKRKKADETDEGAN